MNNTTQAVGRVAAALSTTTSTAPAYYICLVKMDSFEQYMFVFIVKCFVRPAICVLGFSSNMFSLAILKRNGLHKQPNILLCGLVVADSIYLLFGLNYAAILNMFGPNKPFPIYCGFQYDETLDYFLLISHIVFRFIGTLGFYASTLIPVLITVERLLAIFRPMTFKALVTAKRTKMAVVFSFIVWIPWMLCDNSSTQLVSVKLSKTVTFMEIVLQNSPSADIIAILLVYAINSGVSFFTLAFVTIGCCILSIKMSIALKHRRNLTTSQNRLAWSPRTTRTLLVTCLIFVLIHGTITVCSTITEYLHSYQYFFISDIKYYIYPLNASSSFFVYILSNKKLFRNFKTIVRIGN